MTEKEKRDAGLLYSPDTDKELAGELIACKDKCFEYNNIRPSDVESKRKALKAIVGKTGESFNVVSPFWCDYGYNITLGENFYANHNLVILDCAPVTFGKNVYIAPDCAFYTAGHPINVKERNASLEYAKPIKVGDNVWIGGGTRVMPGVSIGSNTVIGAGSVVTKDVPDGVLAFGNPCRVHRKLTQEEIDEKEGALNE